MSMQDWALAYIALAFVAANLPWLSSRLFFFRATAGDKALQWYLLEWLVMYFIVGIICTRAKLYFLHLRLFLPTFCVMLAFALLKTKLSVVCGSCVSMRRRVLRG